MKKKNLGPNTTSADLNCLFKTSSILLEEARSSKRNQRWNCQNPEPQFPDIERWLKSKDYK